MMLRLFLIFVVVNLVVVEEGDVPLTHLKENNSSMQSMLPLEDFSEEKGLRPQRVAPEEGKKKGQEQKKEETWEPTGVAPKRVYVEESDPRMGKLVKSSLIESNGIEPSLVSCLQSSQVALVSLKSSLPNMSSQAQGHLRPNVCTSELFVASELCKCKILCRQSPVSLANALLREYLVLDVVI